MTGDRTDILPSHSGLPTQQALTLLVLEGPDAGRRIPLGDKPLTIGKDPNAGLPLFDATVSRAHCVIERQGENTLVRDLGSTNGTFVDDLRITEAFLRPGAKLCVGKVVLLFQPVFHADEIPPSDAEQFGSLIGHSVPMRRIFSVFERVAATDATILLCGETGTGKGASASSLHQASARKKAPFIVFDCGAASGSLIEGELFGAEKGAYTGATALRIGACEEANGGTLFLDEIDDFPLELQPKLLRILEERELRRLGSTKPISLDIRIIAASKLDLEQAVREGRFRQDLFFRLAVVQVDLPPLRERRDDLASLADGFMGEAGAWDRLSEPLRAQLMAHAWPGNIRELRNVLDRLRYLGLEDALGVQLGARGQGAEEEASPKPDEESGGPALPRVDFERPFKDAKDTLVEAFERTYLERLLERAEGKIAVAAREAHLNRKYFYDLLRKHGLYEKGRKGEG